MFPITISGNTYNSADFIGAQYPIKFGNFAYDILDSLLNPDNVDSPSLFATSASSVAMGVGTKVFTVPAGKGFYPGMPVVATVVTSTSYDAMYGRVASYVGTTLTITAEAMTVDIVSFASWLIGPAPVVNLATGTLATGGTGQATAAAVISEFPLPFYQTRPAFVEDFCGYIPNVAGPASALVVCGYQWTLSIQANATVAGTMEQAFSDGVPDLKNHPGLLKLSLSASGANALVRFGAHHSMFATTYAGLTLEFMLYIKESMLSASNTWSLNLGWYANSGGKSCFASLHNLQGVFSSTATSSASPSPIASTLWDGKAGWIKIKLDISSANNVRFTGYNLATGYQSAPQTLSHTVSSAIANDQTLPFISCSRYGTEAIPYVFYLDYVSEIFTQDALLR